MAVTVDLNIVGSQNTGGLGIDTLVGIENLTGSFYDDTLVGDDNINILQGGYGDDLLRGNGGDDRLDGNEGRDTLIGGDGNDTYIIDDSLDVIVEAAGGGTDVVMAYRDYVLSANIENLTLVGNAGRATGNDLANSLTGNDAANILDGGNGDDTLLGGGGDDTLIGGRGNDNPQWRSGQRYGQLRIRNLRRWDRSWDHGRAEHRWLIYQSRQLTAGSRHARFDRKHHWQRLRRQSDG